MNLVGVVAEAAGEIRNKRLQNLYRTDFLAWQADVLGLRTYRKMQDIAETALYGEIPRTAIKSSNGTSKDLALDTPILTTDGWKTMDSVAVGDYVFSELGEPIRVSWKSEVFNKPSFKVTFDDGAYLVGSGSHEWNTLSLKERGRVRGADDWRDRWDDSTTRTTDEIAATLLNRTGSTRNHLIPLTRPVQFPESDLRMDPYVLGAWIGDGTSARAEITCDYEIDGHVVERISGVYPLQERKSGHYSYSAVSDVQQSNGNWTSQFMLDLKSLGVWRNKHIPEAYMFASIEQRIELVRGLMDTDGWAETRGSSVGWGQSNEALVGQFCDILGSLGVRFSLTSYQPPSGRLAYAVKFHPDFDPFTPGSRKSKTFNASSTAQRSRMTGRTVVSVEEVPSVPTQCIQVDSDRHLYLAGSYLVPTHNSYTMSAMVAWVASVHEPGEALAIVSAPSNSQIAKVTFRYLKSFKARATERGFVLPGHINEQLEWNALGPEGNISLAYGRKPAAGAEVSTFQGVRSEHGKTFVFYDEAGGMARGMWTAAEAVATGADARLIAIGNPDDVGTEWHNIFKEKKYDGNFNRFTISSYDLPTFTNEVVYPDDAEMQERMMKSLTQVSWVDHKKRIWGEKDARFLSKVLGEFPKDGGFGFFPQGAIDLSHETEIPEDGAAPIVLGVDIARMGADECVIAENQGGRVRVVDTWGRTDTVESCRRIHAYANRVGAVEVRIDSSGVGGGVYDMLDRLDEFEGKAYVLVGWDNGSASPDASQWSNKRAWSHDNLRSQMMEGRIDLDYEDDVLRDELQIITYRFNARGAVQITPKEDLKSEIGGSPDRLDAVIMAASDLSAWTGNDLNRMAPGDVVVVDPYDLLGLSFEYGAPGMPL